MNKNLLLTIFLGAAAITGVLYNTQGNQSGNFLGELKYIKEFSQFITDFQRQYSTEEFVTRYQIFSNNMEIIENQNELYNTGKSTYQLGVNQLADLSTAEFKKHYLGYVNNQQEEEEIQTQIIDDSEVLESSESSIDWITKGVLPPVKNQGQCGSCWAFSSIGALEGLSSIQGNKVTSFSEQALMDCSFSYGNNGCKGGIMDNAFKYLAVKGAATEASYPYQAKDGTCRSYTSVFKNKSYKNVIKYSDYFLTHALNENPVSVAIEADKKSFQLYKNGIFDDSSCGTTLDHGVLAVGYGPGYYTIRNSWGSSWGNNGYINLARTGNFNAGICGVQKLPSYPTA